MSAQPSSHLQSTKKKPLELSCLFWSWLSKTSKSNLVLKYKSWMTKVSKEDSEPPTTNPTLRSNHSYVLCLWNWTKDGIRSNSTFLISQEELMEAIMSRPSDSQFMPTAESEESIFATDFIQKRIFLWSLNFSFQAKSRSEKSISLLN